MTIRWSVRYPDLTLMDFYLLNEVKRRVYVSKSIAREGLGQRIMTPLMKSDSKEV